jgi:sugar lactone lactonase YvrE
MALSDSSAIGSTNPLRDFRFLNNILRVEVLLFLALWLSYGLLINDKNITDFKQSQATIEAIVDEHRFSVDNLPVWTPEGDFFDLNGHRYMNKQPGQALVGAVVYAHLKLFGLSYATDRLLTAALIIFFSTSLLTAFGGVVVYWFARDLTGRKSTFWPIAAAVTYGWGTIAFAYSGIAHHDAIAAFFLISGFYLCFRVGNAPDADLDRTRSVAAGVLLGLTLTTSMIPFFVVSVVGLYFLSFRRWNLVPWIVLGGLAGLAPMLAYNTINFGSPFTLPMSLFKFNPVDDVYFKFDSWNFFEKLYVYYSFTNWYGPVLWFGVGGLIFLFFRRPRESGAIALALGVLVFYITNIQTLGTCNYGPRFMLGILPIAALGVGSLYFVPTRPLRWLVAAGFVYVLAQSASINSMGAIGGPMFCHLPTFAFPVYLALMKGGNLPHFLLLPWLLPAVGVLLLLLITKPFISRSPELANDEQTIGGTLTPALKGQGSMHWIGASALTILALVAFYRIWTMNTDSPPRLVQTAPPAKPGPPVNAFNGGRGRSPGEFSFPRGIAADHLGNLYVADSGNSRVQKFSSSGEFAQSFGDGELKAPMGVAVDKAGDIYVTDAERGTLLKFSHHGNLVREWTGPTTAFYGPRDIALGPNDNLYIVDQGRTRVVKFDPVTESFAEWGTRGAEPGQFLEPTGIDLRGGEVFVADFGNNRVQVFDLEGKFLRQWPVPAWDKGRVHFPDVACDEATKTIFVTNGWQDEILAFDADGNAATVEMPAEAGLDNPSSLVITAANGGRRMVILTMEGAKLYSLPLKPPLSSQPAGRVRR